MVLKTNKCCCCKCLIESGTGCCTCVPERICIVADPPPYCMDDPTCGHTAALEWDEESQEYSGVMCGIDLRFYFELIGGQCKLCLESYCAGLTGDYVICHDVECRDIQEMELTYEFDASDCGDEDCEDLVLTVTADKIREVKFCDPCLCTPECLCFSAFLYEGDTIDGLPLCSVTEVVCTEDQSYDRICWQWNPSWPDFGPNKCEAENPPAIDVDLCLKADDYGRCGMTLTGTVDGQDVDDADACGGYEPPPPAPPSEDPKLICPDEGYSTCVLTEDERAVLISALPARCTECVGFTLCCAGVPVPIELIGTVDVYVPASDCLCAQGVEFTFTWLGEIDRTRWVSNEQEVCGHLWQFELNCAPFEGTWDLTFFCDGIENIDKPLLLSGWTCDPFYLEFSPIPAVLCVDNCGWSGGIVITE